MQASPCPSHGAWPQLPQSGHKPSIALRSGHVSRHFCALPLHHPNRRFCCCGTSCRCLRKSRMHCSSINPPTALLALGAVFPSHADPNLVIDGTGSTFEILQPVAANVPNPGRNVWFLCARLNALHAEGVPASTTQRKLRPSPSRRLSG